MVISPQLCPRPQPRTSLLHSSTRVVASSNRQLQVILNLLCHRTRLSPQVPYRSPQARTNIRPSGTSCHCQVRPQRPQHNPTPTTCRCRQVPQHQRCPRKETPSSQHEEGGDLVEIPWKTPTLLNIFSLRGQRLQNTTGPDTNSTPQPKEGIKID